MAIPSTDGVQGQPVRTINNGDVVSKLCDGTTITQLLGIDSAGRITIKLDDGAGNSVTSQVNGSQRALDVGINVSGVQIDPRLAGQYNSTLPTLTSGSFTAPQTNVNGVLLTSPEGDLYPTNISITAQDTASSSTSVFNQTWYSGTPTTGSAAVYTLSSNETGMLEITGTWTGTLQSEISVDGGTNWIAHSIHLIGTSIFTSSYTGNCAGSLNLSAKTMFRVRATTAWTGTATIRLNLSINPSSIYVANSIKLVDGSSTTSSTLMNIVAGTTAAAASNTAIVVAFSPNSPLPAGTNLLGSVNQGTSPWITSDLADGSVAPGTAGTKSMLSGMVYNTAAPNPTNGQQLALQSDNAGNLKVTLETSIPAGVNNIGSVNQGTSPWITSDLADGSVTGGTAGTKSLLGGGVYNSSLPSLTSGQQAALQLNSAGQLLVAISPTTPGNPINNYFVSAANIPYGSSDTHTYTITTGKTFNGKKFWASGSGRIRMDVQTVIGGVTTTVFTGFSSTSNPNVTIDMDEFYVPDSGTTAQIQIVRYNEEPGATFSMFSTICGTEN